MIIEIQIKFTYFLSTCFTQLSIHNQAWTFLTFSVDGLVTDLASQDWVKNNVILFFHFDGNVIIYQLVLYPAGQINGRT